MLVIEGKRKLRKRDGIQESDDVELYILKGNIKLQRSSNRPRE